MRKMYCVLFICFIVVVSLSAKQVDISIARNVARNLVYERVDLPKNCEIKEEGLFSDEEGSNLIYYFNFEPSGWALISAQDNVYPILAYGEEEAFDYSLINPAAKMLIDNYKQQIKWAITNDQIQTEKIRSKWENLSIDNNVFVSNNFRDVSNCLSTEWGQEGEWNQYCPEDPNAQNGFCPAGCVAVAMGQTMKYWNHPINGIGQHIYTHPDYGELGANFSQTYNWTNMLNTVATPETSMLLYHCGVSVEMDYGPDGSGAWLGGSHSKPTAIEALSNHFKYSDDSTYLTKSDYSDTEWEDMLKEQLDRTYPCPIIYRGTSYLGFGGHAFIISGYQGNEFWINWGWTGNSDGWFYLNNLNPVGNNFNYYQKGIFNLYPNSEPEFTATPTSGYAPLEVQFTDQSVYNSQANGNITWEWDFDNDGTIDSNQQNPIHIYSQTGCYSVSLILNNGVNSEIETKSYYIFVNQPPEPLLSNGSVAPNPGTTDDIFEFSIIFQSPAGQSPSDVTLNLDGSTYTMDEQGSNWQNGVEFIKNISSLSQENHSFYFTANNNDLRYPETGSLTFNVTQSAAGWDIYVRTLNSSLSPNNIDPGDDITVTVGVGNLGQYTYNNVPILVELRDPDGNLVDSENSQTGTVVPNTTYSYDLIVHLPSDADDGLYSVILLLLPELDCNPANNTHTLQFYIGSTIDTDQYIVEWENVINNQSNFYVNGTTYYLYGSSSSYAVIVDPTGTQTWLSLNQIDFFNNTQHYITYVGSFSSSAGLSVGYETSGGPEFESTEVAGFRGNTVSFTAIASTGYEFASNLGNYDIWVEDNGNNYVENWFDNVNSNNGFVTANFEFDIPNNANYGTHTFYFHTDYVGSHNGHVSKLRITVLHSSPVITSLDMYEFSADDYLTISGNNFSSSGQVFFNGIEATNIQSWSGTSIICEVPENVSNGTLFITNSYGTSNSASYQIISSTGDPELIQPIPDQGITAGTSTLISDLNNVFWDPNNDDLQYALNYSSTNLTYNPDSLLIGNLFMSVEDNIEEDITISVIATDADNVSIEDIFILSIQDINDPPVIDMIPVQTVNEDEFLIIGYGYLSTYISDPDNIFSDLVLDIVNPANFTVQNTGTEFTLLAPTDWFGSSIIIISAYDGEYTITSNITIIVNPVNDSPILNITIDCELEEDSLAIYNFYEFCDQAWGESDSLYLSATNSTHIDIYIDDFFVTFESNTLNWNGTEDITFYLDDNVAGRTFNDKDSFVHKSQQSTTRDVVSQTVPVTINPINDAPYVANPIPDFSFDEDTIDTSVDLNIVFDDVDLIYGDELTFSYDGNINIGIEIINGSATLIPAPNWFGMEVITFIAIDDSLESVFDEVEITVTPINDPPILNITGTFVADEDLPSEPYDFGEFCEQTFGENDALTLTADNSDNINVTITGFDVVFESDSLNWNGTENITFYLDDNVTDSRNSRNIVNQNIEITVLSVNDPPFVENPITDFSFDEDTTDNSINLNSVFNDVDLIYGDELSFSHSGNDSIDIEIINGLVTLTPDQDWFGAEIITFTATDDSLEFVYDEVEITILPINDPPILNISGTFVAEEDSVSQTYDFSEYCTQTWGENDLLTLTADNSDNINVTITDFDVVFESDSLNWNGTEDITFYLDDNVAGRTFNDKNSFLQKTQQRTIRNIVSQTVPVTINPVNDDPTIILPANFTFPEDDSLVVDFTEFVDDVDPDDLTLSVTGNIEITVSIVGFIVTFEASENWNGTETLTFIINDNVARATAEDDVDVIVTPVNDPPIIISYTPEELTFEIDEVQVVDFEVVAEDIDSPLEYSWFVNQENENNPDSVFTYNFEENGEFEIKCVVNDEDFELETIWNVTVNVTGINDDSLIPFATKLVGSYPNPFNPSTTIKYNLKETANIRIELFNIKGQRITTLVNQNKEAGYHSIVWKGKDKSGKQVSSGLYLYNLVIDNRTVDMKKCLLLK